VKEYDYPICFGMNAGHIEENNPMVFGRKVKLVVGQQVQLSF